MKKLLIFLFVVSGCATKTISVEKLKSDDRLYAGKMNVVFNGKTNKDVQCDLFLTYDVVHAFRLSPNGLYFFKTNRSKMNYGKIVCLTRVNEQPKWLSHDMDFKHLKRSDDELTITTLGTISIDWKVDLDQEFAVTGTKFADDAQEKKNNLGRFKIAVVPNPQEPKDFIQNAVPGLKDPKYKFEEKLFTPDDD